MKKVLRLSESDFMKVVQKVINEQTIMQKPTDAKSLYKYLEFYGVEDDAARHMAKIFEEILKDNVSKEKGMRDFNKKYPNVTLPASIVLTLL